MQYQQLSAVIFLFASLAPAAPAPITGADYGVSLVPRALDWTNQPKTEPKCLNTGPGSPDTAAYTNSDIEAAIQAAVNAIVNNALVKTDSGTPYPHINTPGNAKSSKDSWSDYNLPGCAQGSSDTATKAGFVEFPILREKEVYKGGKGGPDRVLFQFVTDGDTSKTYDTPGFKNLKGNFKSAAYCGMANHVLTSKNQFASGFEPCDNSKGTTVTCPDGGC